jgi:hypothetical protein
MRHLFRVAYKNIVEEVTREWDFDAWHNVGAVRVTASRVIVSHWSTELMVLQRAAWEGWVRQLVQEGTLGF